MFIVYCIATLCCGMFVYAEHFYSAEGQDGYLLTTIFPDKNDGVFVDIGGYDGVYGSNTLACEKRGWRGICFEPIPLFFTQLKQRRNCICIQGCVSDHEGYAEFLHVKHPVMMSGGSDMLSGLVEKYDPRHLEAVVELATKKNCTFEIFKVPCYLLNKMLDAFQFDHIDLLCVDTEGGEYDILCSIDWDHFDIDVVIVEEIYADSPIQQFLESKGFVRLHSFCPDVLYRNKKYMQCEQ